MVTLILFVLDQPVSWRGRPQGGRQLDSTLRFCYKSVRGGLWREKTVWQRAELETAQCTVRRFGVGKTNVMSPGARAAAETRRNAAGNPFCSCVELRFYTPEALGWW